MPAGEKVRRFVAIFERGYRKLVFSEREREEIRVYFLVYNFGKGSDLKGGKCEWIRPYTWRFGV